MIQNRVLVITESDEVLKYHSSRRKYIKLKVILHWKSGRRQYAIRVQNKYRKIGAAKLLWMIVKNKKIPDGFDVDHINKDRHDDRLCNLRLRESLENQCDNISANQLKEAIEYFSNVGFCASTCIVENQ